MQRLALVSLALCAAILVISCAKKQEPQPAAVAPVTITQGTNSAGYPGAAITIVSPKADEVLKDDSVGVVVDLTGFDVAVPTPGDKEKGLAYSKPDSAKPDMLSGQHVHIILDNDPYMACYVKGQKFWFPKRLSPGAHTLRVFPSRSWHESVKQPGCFVAETFYVKEHTGTPVDLTKPYLTYSRPKGEYAGAGAKQVMVDFYLSNCELGAGKYTAKITVDTTASMIAETWCPYMITGLAAGSHTVNVTLVAPDGKPVEGVWNATQRTITIK